MHVGMGNNSFRDSEPFQSLHLKFIKETIGVNHKAFNYACRSELNILPMNTKIYFGSIFVNSNNTIVHKIYLATENNNPCVKNLKSMIAKMGFEYLILNPTNLTFYLRQIQIKINDLASQEQDSLITAHSLNFFVKYIKLGKGLHM
jgi:hypothetical protein